MKVVILAGGRGTRITEESQFRPKPMIEIGDMPILWHIMKIYAHFGHNDFIICCGYKGYMIKEFFANYYLRNSDVTFDFRENTDLQIHNSSMEPWKVTLVDTGLDTMTGGRIKRIKEYIGEDKTFLMTYGDGVSDVDINKTIESHIESKKSITMTVIQPEGRYGSVSISRDNTVNSFIEKPEGDGGWINGGFFVLNRDIFDYIESDKDIFEGEPLSRMATEGKINAYKHIRFWHSMDSLRDKVKLDEMWAEGNAKWKVWE